MNVTVCQPVLIYDQHGLSGWFEVGKLKRGAGRFPHDIDEYPGAFVRCELVYPPDEVRKRPVGNFYRVTF